MTPTDPLPTATAEFDRHARALYRQSLEQVPGDLHARLARSRREALATSHVRWARWLPAGVAATAVLAFAAMVGLQHDVDTAPEAPLAHASPAIPAPTHPLAHSDPELALILDSLDNNPDFYLWLASNDDAAPER